jgi:hypothetical protein
MDMLHLLLKLPGASQFNNMEIRSQLRLAVINCCIAGINPFFSNTSSGTVPQGPPRGIIPHQNVELFFELALLSQRLQSLSAL